MSADGRTNRFISCFLQDGPRFEPGSGQQCWVHCGKLLSHSTRNIELVLLIDTGKIFRPIKVMAHSHCNGPGPGSGIGSTVHLAVQGMV